MVHKAQPGYILLLTTFIIATSILLISLVVSRVTTYRQLTKASAEKDTARLIARSGIDIAISQLMVFTEQKEKKTEKKQDATQQDQTKKDEEKEEHESAADFVLKKLNKWQKFDLTEKHEGIEATCSIYITSEQGKIAINNLYDFEKKQFKILGTTDGKKVLEFITDRMKPIFEAQHQKVDFVQLVEQAFQQRNAPLDDISQIITPKDSETLQGRLFPAEDQKDKIALIDVFTTTKTQNTHPLVLTPSIKLLAGFKAPDKNAKEKPTNDQIDNILTKQIADWSREWEPVLSLLYSTNYVSAPESLKSLFANKFESNLFFVVSYGTVGLITEKIAALIEKNQTGATKDTPFVIRKLYWLWFCFEIEIQHIMVYRKNETLVGLFVIIALAIFTYLIFQIGVIRFDHSSYNNYTICFVDLAGLTKKDDLRMAGVKVGFIQDITLLPGQQCPVRARVKIITDCQLYQDAYAVVRQDGLLGHKFLEIVPGSFNKPHLEPNSMIPCKPEGSASIDNVLCKANTIVSDIQQVTCSVKQALTDSPEIKCVKETITQVKEIATQLADISKSLNQLIATNQNTVNTVVKDVAEIVTGLKKELPAIVKDIKATTDNIANKITPHVQNNIESLTSSIKEKIDTASEKINATVDQINSVASKINNGEGSLGKLLNDKDTYDNVKVSVQCLQNTASRWSNVKFGFDAPFEAYHCFDKPGAYNNDFKGYLNGYIWPTHDIFITGGIEGRHLGSVKHEDVFQGPVDDKHHDEKAVISKEHEVKREYDHWLWNLQVGKTFNNLCLRGGIFESTFGLGIDYTFPFATNSYLQTSLEAYDFFGKLRINDDRPHLRWMNRLYFNPNVYLAFGVDDFISKQSKSFFVGAGIAFGSILHIDQKNV